MPKYTHPLDRAAWYSETSGNRLHAVGKRVPASAGVFDLPGNVREWRIATHDSTCYARSPAHDPVNAGSHGDRACRGGALNSFAAMRRPRYRYHEPPDYWAAGLGFRLAADALSEGVSAYPNVPDTVSASKRCSENESKEHDE